MNTECPSCHYVRQDVDTASPEGQCPQCGIVYAKFDPAVDMRRERLKKVSEQRLYRESVIESARINAAESKSWSEERWGFFSKAVRLLIVGASVVTLIYWWPGSMPTRKNVTPQYLEDARRSVTLTLNDPESAQFRDVRQGRAAVCGEVNAKNRFGGYVGFRRFFVTPAAVVIDDEANAERFERDWNMSC